jgi:hypothetical protein
MIQYKYIYGLLISVIGLLVIVSDCVTSNDLLIKFHKGGIRDFNKRVC